MAFSMDESWIYGGQLIVSAEFVTPQALGIGPAKIDHSVYIQGPLQVGEAGSYGSADATVMIGPNGTVSTPDSLYIKGNKTQEGDTLQTGNKVHKGNTTQTGNTDQTGTITASGNITSKAKLIGDITQTSGTPPGCKLFDIKHPNKEGHRLAHACIEGPEVAVYYRGRTNKNVIDLPLYWEDLVDPASITVSLTPIGAHQDIIVKRFDAKNIHLQAQGGMPIHCFFHVFGERKDVEKLIVEYPGESPADYPGDNSGYSIAGYNYDVRE